MLLFLILGGVAFLLFRCLNFDGLYGQDAYAYQGHAQSFKSYFLGGDLPPKFFWPINYPMLAAIIDLVINDFTITLQFISILSWSSIGYFSFCFLQQLYPCSNQKIILWFVISIISFSPYLFRFAGCSMSDELTTLFVLLCFKSALNIKNKNALLHTLIFALLAVFTRYGALVLVITPLIYSCYIQLKLQNYKFYLSAVIIVLIGCFPYFYFNGFEIGTTLQKSVTSDWSFINWVHNEFKSPEGLFTYDFPNIIYATYGFLHPMFLFLGVPLIIFSLYARVNLNKILLTSIILYALFIAGIHFQNKRFFVLSIPLITIMLFTVFDKALCLVKNRTFKATILSIVLLINLGFSAYTTKVVLSISNYENMILSQLSDIKGQELYTFEIDIVMKGRNVPNNYYNLWEHKSISPKKGSLMLINPEKWEHQWKTHHVMKHCQEIESSGNYFLIKKLSGGWKIYEKL